MSSSSWGLIDHPALAPGYNMAVDWWLTRNVSLPVLRLYGWNRAVLSLGYRQQFRPPDRLENFLDRFEVVVRPTGGGYLLHSGALTYSLVLPETFHLSKKSVEKIYKRVRNCFFEAARGLNLVNSHRLGNGSGSLARDCLAAPASHEPTRNGRKWLAAAQLHHQGAVLQHGSFYWDSSQWPEEIELSRPGFLNDSVDESVSADEFIRKFVSLVDSDIFEARTCCGLHLSSSDWARVESYADCFQLSSERGLPVFER